MELGRRHVMIAKDRGRGLVLVGFAVAFVATAMTWQAWAQQDATQQYRLPPAAPNRQANTTYQPNVKGKVNVNDINVPGLKPARIPVNPSDPIANVNNQPITRQQLADECLAREGKKVLELLINRTLIDQELHRRKMDVTAAEIDQEIETVARRFGITREGWLRTLDKERGISPFQYARDIIYPAIALRKLSSGRVTVTPSDLKNAFEAQYGEKLRCRMIMVDKSQKAIAIWEQLRQNPGGFEKIAQDQSIDSASRSLGGLVGEPITRHAYPQTLSDAAFYQLVDGDASDHDPTHKPKDGDFTGPIQVGESVWVILRRESIVAAATGLSLKDPQVAAQTRELIYEVKLKEAMADVFRELIKASSIENLLVGSVKLANEEKDPDYGVDDNVKLMSRESGSPADQKAAPTAASPAQQRAKLPPPAALSAEAAKQYEKMNRPLKPGGNATTSSNPNGTGSVTTAPTPPSN
jgi:parvulin-like peptidyl-prolyl isomerase